MTQFSRRRRQRRRRSHKTMPSWSRDRNSSELDCGVRIDFKLRPFADVIWPAARRLHSSMIWRSRWGQSLILSGAERRRTLCKSKYPASRPRPHRRHVRCHRIPSRITVLKIISQRHVLQLNQFQSDLFVFFFSLSPNKMYYLLLISIKKEKQPNELI